MQTQAELNVPRILIVDDQHMSQEIANQLFLRVKHAQLSSVGDINRACDAMPIIGCDYIIVNQSSQLDQINGLLNRQPTGLKLKGVFWITNQEKVSFNPEILSKVKVYLMDPTSDSISDKIELVAHGWQGVSH